MSGHQSSIVSSRVDIVASEELAVCTSSHVTIVVADSVEIRDSSSCVSISGS